MTRLIKAKTKPKFFFSEQTEKSVLDPQQQQQPSRSGYQHHPDTDPKGSATESVKPEVLDKTREDESKLFAQVSQDVSEMVQHLNTIQHDISELAGRPISIYDNS